MAIYIEHDYYPMDVYSEPDKADPRERIRSAEPLDAYAQVQLEQETNKRIAA